MKKFIGKICIFLCLYIVIMMSFLMLSSTEKLRTAMAYLTDSTDYKASGTDELTIYFEQIREPGDYTKLVVGDSVCNQLTSGLRQLNTDYSLVGNNRAITIAGEYLLVKEFLETHEGITDVYLMITLDALQTEIDTVFGYQYVVIPFAREDMLQDLDEKTLKEMENTFGSFFLQKPVAKLVAESSVNKKLYVNYINELDAERQQREAEKQIGIIADESEICADVAAEYLVYIYELCEQYGVTLHLLPCPIADNEGRHTQAEELEQDFIERGLDELFPDFFELLVFYPEEQFGDGIHFAGDYDTQEEFNRKLQELYIDKGYLENLVITERKYLTNE